MGVSKVVLGDETLIDLTSDSVSPENLLKGATAHGANGEPIEGIVVVTDNYKNLNNKPSINGTELSGNKSLSDLGIASATDLQKVETKVDTIIEKAELNIKNSASGENIHLTDSANSKVVEFGLYGKATQDGEPTPDNPIEIEVSGESYNLLENTATSQTINGVSFVVNEDKSVTLNGKATGLANLTVISGGKIPLLKNGEKYLLSGCTGGNDSTYEIYIYKVDVGYVARNYNGDTEFIYDSSATYNVGFVVREGVTVNNLTFYPMIRKASVQNNRYMPYGKGSVEVKSVGKNLLEYPYQQTTKVVNGITFTDNKDGTITTNGTATALSLFYIKTVANSSFYLEKGNYILSGNPSDGTASTYKMRLEYGSNKIIGDDIGNGVNVNITPELSNEPLQLVIMIYSGQTVSNLTFKPMIRHAEITDDTYEPYKETTSTIPTPNGLPGIPVSSGGNYTDENGQQWICDEVVKYADGSGKRIQRIKKAIFDGTEGWALSGSSNFAYLSQAMKECIVEVNTKRANLLSNYSYAQSQNWLLYTVVDYGVAISSDGSPSIRIKECTTLEDYIAYLSNTPLQIVAEVTTEPIITDLSAEEIAEIEKLYTFYPVTNISNDADCGMSIKYLCDSKNYIDNRLAQIEAVLINNI